MDKATRLILYERFKKFKSGNKQNDRLSKLPEDILGRILSLLPTKDVVRTSVLSREWKYMWALATNLHFYDRHFYSSKRKGRKTMFINFVDRVLRLHENSNIESFSLTCYEDYYNTLLYSWIFAAMKCNAKRLRIHRLVVRPNFVFPRCVFVTKSLVELELRMHCVFRVPTLTYFSSLRKLDLREVTLENETVSLSKELNLSLPVLEVLKFKNCEWKDAEIVNICVPALESFTVENYNYKLTPNSKFDCVFNVCGPSLAKFKWSGNALENFVFRSPASIVDATIEVSTMKNNWNLTHELCLRIFSLLRQFCNVKSLTLCNAALKALAKMKNLRHCVLPTFDSVINLTISRGDLVFDVALKALLRSSPALQSLVFEGGISHVEEEEVQQGTVPQCLMSQLKVVKIRRFDWRKAEIEAAKFFLKNATFLEEMHITAYGDRRFCAESKNRLLASPRGSSCAKLFFS